MIGFLGPDFLFGIAIGQLSSARRCVRLFREDNHLLKGTKWTLRYAFFTNMGGLHLTSPDFPNGFPIKQLHYLVKHDHVDFPNMKAMAIDERNTTDTLSNLVTIWQVIWYSVAEIQRTRDGLPMTTLELTSLSFVVMMIATSICWFRKPSITIPQSIPTKNGKLIYKIRADAKEQTHPGLNIEVWYRTPLDFIHDDRWGIDTHWSYYTRLSHIMYIKVFSRSLNARPWDRLPSDQWLPPEKALIPLGVLVLPLFSVSFLIAWNFYFLTKIEQWLWRGFATYHAVFVLYGGSYYLIEALRWEKRSRVKTEVNVEAVTLEYSHSAQTLTSLAIDESNVNPEAQLHRLGPLERVLSRNYLKWVRMVVQFFASWRNISADRDPAMAMPLRVIIPVTVTCVLYVFARGFLYIEDIISLRRQPANIYQSVNKYIPFLGDG
ncbi:hypothetical protein F5Y12DRAFT_793767 [Xylaria sp. FL1777]|nr:hypothetical protein F5Y12DRAFT_793767 [Xylaria sp. FL1777]